MVLPVRRSKQVAAGGRQWSVEVEGGGKKICVSVIVVRKRWDYK